MTTAKPKEEERIPFEAFLEKSPPSVQREIRGLGTGTPYYSNTDGTIRYLATPDINTFCKSDKCNGERLFSLDATIQLKPGTAKLVFLEYVCKNCTKTMRAIALWVRVAEDLTNGTAYKFGEYPPFGPSTPARVISLIGPQKDLYLAGRRAESQGMGIGAFAYYRRVIEGQKDRIFDEIIRVCNRLSTDPAVVEDLTNAKNETQFSKAVWTLPQASG